MFSTDRFAFLIAVILLAGGALAPRPALSTEAQVAIAIEQGGAVVPVEKNTVTLHKAPFSIVLTLTGSQAISVSASGSDGLIKAAKKHRLADPFTNQFKALPLENKNPGETLFVVDDPRESYAYYFYANSEDHRFSEVTHAGTQIIGKLRVSKLWVADAAVPLAAYSGKDLYLVFATTEDTQGGKSKVTWSDYLHIRFER